MCAYKEKFIGSCPTYDDATRNFYKSLKLALTFDEKEKIFNDFADRFTLFPYLWIIKDRLCSHSLQTGYPLPNENVFKANKIRYFRWFKHLFYEGIDLFRKFGKLKSMPFNKTLSWCYKRIINEFKEIPNFETESLYFDKLVEALTFPHSRIIECYNIVLEFSDAPHPLNDYYTKMLKNVDLYNEIISTKSDEEWFDNLLKTDDHECICNNIESRITKNSLNIKIWKIYLNFLMIHDSMKMLEWFRRFTRFFVDDVEMREEYRKQIENIGAKPAAVAKFWIDTIRFELHFGSIESARSVLKRSLDAIMLQPKSLFRFARKFEKKYGNAETTLETIKKVIEDANKKNYETYLSYTRSPNFYFQIKEKEANQPYYEQLNSNKCMKPDFDNYLAQFLSLPLTIMAYVMKSLKKLPYRQYKLFKTCKYFYAQNKTPICYRLTFIENLIPTVEYRKQSLILSDPNFLELEKLKLVNTLHVKTSDPYVLSKLTKKFSSCILVFLKLMNQHLTSKEYIFLTESKTLQAILFIKVVIKQSNGLKETIENIMEKLTMANDISINDSADITENSAKKLAELKRFSKIKRFILSINNPLNAEDFCDFLKINAEENSMFKLTFNNNFYINNNEGIEFFKNNVKIFIAKNWNEDEKPRFYCEIPWTT